MQKPLKLLFSFLREMWLVPVVAVVLTVITLQWNNWPGWRLAFSLLGLNLILSFWIGLAFSVLYTWVTGPWIPRTRGRLLRLLLHVLTILAAVGGGGEIALRIIEQLDVSWWPDIGEMRGNVIRFGSFLGAIIVAVIVAFERLQIRSKASEERARLAQQEALKARLDALKARTNPHFLFNSLNTVAGLIEEDPETAERAIEKLSALLRFTLDGSRRDRIQLGEELAAVRSYLDVERLRFGDRLGTTLDLDSGVEGIPVPPLILQPLVENAVLHGIAPRREGGRLWVRAGRETNTLILSVEDDGPGPNGSAHRGSRTSLRDLTSRLELAYAGRATLKTGSRADGGYRVEITLPIEETG